MTDSDAAYTVDIEEIDGPVRAGETVSVAVTVENDGADAGEVAVKLAADGEQVDSETLELDADAGETVEFDWTAGADAVGTVDLAAETTTDSATATVTVEDAPASFAVETDSVDEHVSEGGTATLVVTVTNEGTLPDTQKIEFRVGGEPRETTTLELEGQASETLEFEHEVPEGDAPETPLAVASEDDEAEASVPVVPPTTTPLRKLRSKSGMGPFGWLMFVIMVILFIPLIPILVLIKLFDMLFGRGIPAR